MTELRIAGALAVLFVLSTPANAQSRIGSANSVKPEASGSIAGTLSAGSSVHANETVKTGGSGQAALGFIDKTNLHVGPASTVRLDKFVYDPNKGTGSVVMMLRRVRLDSRPVHRIRAITKSRPHLALSEFVARSRRGS